MILWEKLSRTENYPTAWLSLLLQGGLERLVHPNLENEPLGIKYDTYGNPGVHVTALRAPPVQIVAFLHGAPRRIVALGMKVRDECGVNKVMEILEKKEFHRPAATVVSEFASQEAESYRNSTSTQPLQCLGEVWGNLRQF